MIEGLIALIIILKIFFIMKNNINPQKLDYKIPKKNIRRSGPMKQRIQMKQIKKDNKKKNKRGIPFAYKK